MQPRIEAGRNASMKILLLFTGMVTVALVVAACATSRSAYESARYRVVREAGRVEIRDYPELKVASTASAAGNGRDGKFMRLFGYISGKNERSEKIAMTTPVFMAREGGEEKMSFVVPEKVASAGVPAPAAEEVKIESMPAARYAVLRFTGGQSAAREQEALTELRNWLESEKIPTSGDPVFAYFDPPWTPGPLRRNEVMLRVGKQAN